MADAPTLADCLIGWRRIPTTPIVSETDLRTAGKTHFRMM